MVLAGGCAVAGGRAVVREHPRVVREARVERQPEQAALVVLGIERHDPVADVEERPLLEAAVAEDQDQARLVDHERTARPIGRGDESDRRGQAVRDDSQRDIRGRRRRLRRARAGRGRRTR